MESIWDCCVASVRSCHVWIRQCPVRKSVEEEQLLSVHDLCIPSQNQRNVRLKEIVYCRGSQHLSCFVEPLAVAVALPYPRPYSCFEIGRGEKGRVEWKGRDVGCVAIWGHHLLLPLTPS